MATLYFKVGADYDKVIRLREEIKKLKAEMASFDGSTPARTVSQTQKQLNSTNKEYEKMLNTAARAGDEMQNGYRKSAASLSAAQKNVDLITGRMIEQKAAVANLQSEVRRLAEAYRMADAGNKKTANKQLSSAKSRLEDERVALNKLRSSQESARLTVKGLRDDVSGYERVLRQSISTQADANSSFAKLRTMMIGAFTIQQAGQFIKSVAQVRGQFQQLEVAFDTMLGSKAKADALMAQIVETAAKTPFDLQGVANGAKQLLAYGVASEQVNETLIRLGNISAGLSIPLGDLVYLYGTTMTQGRLFTQDLRQFMGRGIPLADELAKQFGVTKDQVGALVTAGKVGFPEVQKAIEAMTGEGGKFYNLMEAQSKTITGQISNLGDAWDTMLNEIGKSSEGAISTALSGASYLVEHYDTVGKIIAGLIATYGAYKAAVIVATSVCKGYTIAELARYRALLLAEKAQKLLNATMLSNPYVAITVGVVALGAALWALHDGTTAEEKAQQKLNDELAQAKQRKQDLISKAESLIGKINSETESVYGQVKAYQELIKLFPELKGMTFEEFKSMPEGQQSKKVNEIAEDRRLKEIEQKYDLASKAINAYKSRLAETTDVEIEQGNRWTKSVLRTLGVHEQVGTVLGRKLKQGESEKDVMASLRKLAEGYKGDLDKATQAQWEANAPLTEKIRHYETVRDRLLDERAQLEQVLSSSQDTSGEWQGWSMILNGINGQLDEVNGKIKGFKQSADTKTWGKTEWDKQLKEASDSINKIPIEKLKLLKLGPESAARKGVSKEDINSYQKLIGLQKAAKEALKTYEEPKGNSDALRKREQLNNALAQADLDLQLRRTAMMREGKEKRLAEIDLEHRQTVAKINNDRTAKKADGATDTQLGAYDKLTDEADVKRIHDRAQIEKQYASELTETYRQLADVFVSEEERKTRAIEQKYQGMRNKAVDDMLAGNIDGSEFIALNIQIDAAEACEGTEDLLEKYQSYADRRKEIEEQFNSEIATLQSKNENGKYDAQIQQAEKQKKEALSKIDFEEQKKGIDFTQLFGNLDNLTLPSMKSLRDKIKAWIDSAGKSLSPEDLKAVSDAFNNLELKISDKDPFTVIRTAVAGLKEANEDVKTAQEELNAANQSGIATTEELAAAEKKLTDAQNGRAAVVSKAQEALSSAADKGQQTVGAAKDVMTIMSDLGINVPDEIAGAIDGVGQMMDGLAGIDLTKPLSIVTGGIKMIGGLVKSISSIFNGDNKKEKEIQRLKTQIDALDVSYKKLDEAINEAYSTDASKLIGEQNKLLQQQKVLIQNQIAAEESKKDTDDEKIDAWQGQIDEIDKTISDNKVKAQDAIFGADVKSAIDEFAQAYADAWTAGEDRAKAMKDVVKNMIKGVIIEMLKNDLAPTIQKIRNEIESMLVDGVIDDYEQSRLDSIIESAASDADKKYDWADKYLKGDEVKEGNDASSKGFASMSQDTGDELNGRFTAIQMSTHEILNLLGLLNPIETKISAQIASLLVVNTQTRDIADEIRTIQVNSFLELQQISTHTRSMDKILKLIHSDLAQVKTNTANL